MGQYFALILNNSVTVSILIAVLLVFRGLCKKISRRMICFLWIVAGPHGRGKMAVADLGVLRLD